MEVVQVTPGDIENAWVEEDVQLRDGVANAQSPAVFIATIGYPGRGRLQKERTSRSQGRWQTGRASEIH